MLSESADEYLLSNSEVCHPRCAFNHYPANVENMVSS